MTDLARKQATLHDVARLANVSHQTVSRVINLSPNVADETRERVLKAIEILNYRPNRAARSLITGRSQTIQVIDFEASYLTPIPAIVSAAAKMGYRTGLTIIHQPSKEEIHHLLDDLTSRLVDGFVLFDPQVHLDASDMDRMCRGIPYVQLGGEPMAGAASVIFDHTVGVRQVMDHLYSLGHRKIAEICGRLDYFDGLMRHQAYMDWMEERGLEPGPVMEGDFTTNLAYCLMQKQLEEKAEFSAVICANDSAALGALRSLHAHGYRIPADISIVGYDDHPPVVYYEPPLTTVKQDYATLSRVGIEYLVEMINHSDTPREMKVLIPQLIVRESTQAVTVHA